MSRAQRTYEARRRIDRAAVEGLVEAFVLLRLSRDPMARAICSWGTRDRGTHSRAAVTLAMLAAAVAR